METKIRDIVGEYADLSVEVSSLAGDADLYAAGMTSHASVNVMLALEDEFGVSFPDSLLKRSVFESIDSIATAVGSLSSPARV